MEKTKTIGPPQRDPYRVKPQYTPDHAFYDESQMTGKTFREDPVLTGVNSRVQSVMGSVQEMTASLHISGKEPSSAPAPQRNPYCQTGISYMSISDDETISNDETFEEDPYLATKRLLDSDNLRRFGITPEQLTGWQKTVYFRRLYQCLTVL